MKIYKVYSETGYQKRISIDLLLFLCEKYRITSVVKGDRLLNEDLTPYYNEYHVDEETREIPVKCWKRAI